MTTTNATKPDRAFIDHVRDLGRIEKQARRRLDAIRPHAGNGHPVAIENLPRVQAEWEVAAANLKRGLDELRLETWDYFAMHTFLATLGEGY